MMEQRYSAKTIGEVGKSFIEIGKLYLTVPAKKNLLKSDEVFFSDSRVLAGC